MATTMLPVDADADHAVTPMDPLRAAAIRTLFVQIRTSVASGFIVTAYLVAAAWPYTPTRIVLGWGAAQVATQLAREGLRRAWHRRAPDDAALVPWVHAYTALMALAGLLWGASIVLFAHPDQPITVALTLCGLFGMSGGAVAGQAYNPPGLYALIWLTFGTVLVRLVATEDTGYVVLGITCGTFGLAMTAFGRVQAGVLREGFRIRFENQALVEALTVQKAEAEDARRQAELASLAKSQFLAAASHDLRQPLYALGLFSASLGTLRLDEQGRSVVGNIQDSIAVMESLFVGLLDLSKLEAGTVEALAVPVSVDALFDRLSQYSLPIAIERGLDLRFRSGGEWVASDPVLLEQVLSNLVANALRYTARGGVLVAARPRREGVSLEVWDTGPGIADADRERIFQEFVQLGNHERDRRKGLGLGLSIVRRSSALLGAGVSLASRPGLGSRFSLVQPVAAPPTIADAREAGISGAATDVQPLQRDPALPLLLIDDDPSVRAALGGLLARWGVAARAVADADAALALVDAGERFGLVLADYRLGGDVNGLDLLAAIAARHAAPVPTRVLVTGDFDPGLLAAAHAAGVPVLHKPVRPADLRALLGLGADPVAESFTAP